MRAGDPQLRPVHLLRHALPRSSHRPGDAMKTVVIGVGNEYRHDDAAGLAAVEQLRRLDPPGVEFADSDGEPTSLIELWSGADLAVVVDGVAPSGEPGRIYRLG